MKKISVNGKKYNLFQDENCDESNSNGCWDLAGDIALRIGFDLQKQGLISDDEVVYREDFGQEVIYSLIKSILRYVRA